MVNLVIGTLLLAFFLAWCVHIVADVVEVCRRETAAAEHEELLDAMWSDE